MQPIRIRGARTHNLQGIDLELVPGQLVCFTGVSGAGKSSLALDTLYSEGQRRFVESFSPYARQFLERLERPPIDELDPVAAGVAVDRRAPVKSSRSTVATMADLEPYLSAVFAREATPVCPTCQIPATRVDAVTAASKAVESHDGATALVTYRVPVAGTEELLDVRETLLEAGYRRLLVRGEVRDIDEVGPSDALGAGGGVEVIVDRVKIGARDARRLGSAIEEAWQRAEGGVALYVGASGTSGTGRRVLVPRGLACPSCARSFDAARPGLFSYQSPIGACPGCRGFGRTIGVDWGKVIPDEEKTLEGGAIRPWTGSSTSWERKVLRKFCEKKGIPLDVPWKEFTEAQRAQVLDGEGSFHGGKYPGVRAWFKWLETRTYKMHIRVLLARYRSYDPCATCDGKRLSPESLLYRVGGLDLASWHGLELREARALLDRLKATTGQGEIARKELAQRLSYLERVGLGYLTLDRQARTLSGGEAQRVTLTGALGTSLTGALFVLDEPTVGLHPSDVPPLIEAMRELAARGNVVVVIEHEPLVIRASDRVVELGPGAGKQGGRVVFDGAPAELARRGDLPTGRALARGAASVASADERTAPRGSISIVDARANNLKDVSVRMPLGQVVCVTGASGSGKSTLVEDVLYRALARARGYKDIEPAGAHKKIEGTSGIKVVTLVDQAPLGRTSRGNPATYTGAWNRIRQKFAAEPEAAARQLTAGHFSFNVALGRCESCAGEGAETIEMQFLADVSLTCPVCQGKRFRDEVLQVKLDGRSVADVLALSIDEALEVFAREPAIVRALGPLARLGLGYLTLGQPLSTLSGGEAQRLKLARALGERTAGALFLLDEPSAGLHAEEVLLLNQALRDLVRGGGSVIVVDHDLDVIAAADWVVDLGPGAGSDGGQIVAEGTAEEVARTNTRTGHALAAHLARPSSPPSSSRRKGKANGDASRRATPAYPPAPSAIEIVHAREHNLAEVCTSIPHGQIVVVTGPSGSGKSTLAFDVVFAEGQRRFLETLTPYARQFLPSMPRPDVDRVTGVPPAIALEQRTTRSGSNSTVATVTEIAHYLRLLFAKVGEPHCPTCDVPITARAPDEVYRALLATRGARTLLAPAVVARKGTYLDVFTAAARAGITDAIVDGARASTDDPPRLDKRREHSIDLVMHEGKLDALDRATFDRALTFGKGSLKLVNTRGQEELLSTTRTCPRCGAGVPELDPRWFSFNTKQGRCEACEGTGVLGGSEDADPTDASNEPCTACGGSRLAPVPRSVRLAGDRYHEATARSVSEAVRWAKTLRFDGERALIAEAPHRELARRLAFVEEVGLGYLALDRRAATLSGGEMQRLRLAAQLGSGLTGALYVLDEPTIGLHPRDTHRLLDNLRKLAGMGSTVLMVEHDADTIRAADYLIDLGPTGGRGGGRIVAQGTPSEVLRTANSPTAKALSGERALASARVRLGPADAFLEIEGARAHNLRVDALRVPLGRMTVVAGVSGSGKSTLVRHVLYPAVRRALGLAGPDPGPHDALHLPPSLARAVAVDQSPIGRTPRSIPATFLGVWDEVRKLFAATPDAKMRGYDPARFSFNTAKGGRCEVCEGQGVISHEMSFLPDVVTTCEACGGTRFEPATLDVRYLGMSIGDVLLRTAEEAAELFAAHPKIREPLATMCDLGVGYLRLGQGSHTLSGGEAQRLKLADELCSGTRAKPTLYVLDEPTTGLHLSDVARLVAVLDRLVQRGHSLLIIEHHPAVIAAADHVIELGPEGGKGGGRVVAEGSPEVVARRATATGRVLRALFERPASDMALAAEA
ncbi:excinuclease ABC subunit UvrA [Polyangium fumosum]|uniref:UvrABC system protein A n=1 Tax=Polyangium fumosum TaxID=889272 RepID=A0A4U1JJP1_9BACT|nr:excinuclease ABC subunit UvrA [Polyangium fumosum]TKD12036.1 excinuclease ABC subunit A [Polyangium fumosum]